MVELSIFGLFQSGWVVFPQGGLRKVVCRKLKKVAGCQLIVEDLGGVGVER